MHLIAGAHGRPLNPSGLSQLFLIQFAVDTPVEQRFVAEVWLCCGNCSQFSEALVEIIHSHPERMRQITFFPRDYCARDEGTIAQGTIEFRVGRGCIYAHSQHVSL